MPTTAAFPLLLAIFVCVTVTPSSGLINCHKCWNCTNRSLLADPSIAPDAAANSWCKSQDFCVAFLLDSKYIRRECGSCMQWMDYNWNGRVKPKECFSCVTPFCNTNVFSMEANMPAPPAPVPVPSADANKTKDKDKTKKETKTAMKCWRCFNCTEAEVEKVGQEETCKNNHCVTYLLTKRDSDGGLVRRAIYRSCGACDGVIKKWSAKKGSKASIDVECEACHRNFCNEKIPTSFLVLRSQLAFY